MPPSPAPAASELPWAFIDCPTDTLVTLLAHMLDLLIRHNDQVTLTPDALTRFHSRAPPGISVQDYLARIVKYTNCEKIPLLSLLSYIDITCLNLPTFTLSSLTVHRFLIASICAGSKAQCDVFCTNAHYAKVGGIKTGELNALERELVRVTEWDLCCHAETLQRYYTSLIRSHGGYTQAPEPATSPFVQFPDPYPGPTNKNREEGDTAGEEGEGDGCVDCAPGQGHAGKEVGLAGAGTKDEDQEMPLQSSPARPPLNGSLSEDPAGPQDEKMVVDPSPTLSARGRPRRRRTSHMDVDPSRGHLSKKGKGSERGGEGEGEEEGGSPYSAASSSVPSSSRSRGGSQSSRRNRTGGSPRDMFVNSPGVTEVGAGVNGEGVPAGAGIGTIIRPTPDVGHPSQPSLSQEPTPQALPKPPLSTNTSTSSQKDLHPTHSHPQGHGHPHHPHAPKFLKNLGNMFRKKSSPGAEDRPAEGDVVAGGGAGSGGVGVPAPQSGIGAGGGAGGGGGAAPESRQHAIISSKPLRSLTRANPSQSQSTRTPIPPFTNPPQSPRGRPPAPAAESPEGGDKKIKLTPRIRTRGETSLDSPRERVWLGSGEAPTAGLGGSAGVGMGTGVGAGEGDGDEGVDGPWTEEEPGKRAKA
ncbi:alternative cyclin Pho80 [Cryptococcus wingfieldii CBS 7118]|uniref:Alternative cyclin Pho80 n=1 Tax=Cryptococcus wingfieldii CBS 7118 TaxID=1295528 RepID=A0A1E3JM15_9TREE|nr:alternative cyclin Pho80 [Cryptococcus wingfieldii CBS 7118]ODO01911.1 alternative cyclin Pho80 [Cryptococcus wingfieldii CBS 7118]